MQEGGVHEISIILGELRAHHTNAKETSAKLFEKFDDLETRFILVEKMSERLHIAEETIKDHGETLKRHDKVVQRAAGVGIAAGVGSSFLGWLLK